MTRQQLLKSMSSTELSQWMALDNLDGYAKLIHEKDLEADDDKKSDAITSMLFGQALPKGTKNG